LPPVVASDSSSLGPVFEQVNTWVPLALEAATRFGTPCYLSRWLPVERTVESLEGYFARTITTRSWLSYKTHPVPQLAREWIRSGRGVEVVSEAEFTALQALRCPQGQLLVNGVAKHSWLHRQSVPGLRVHFDSIAEVMALRSLARSDAWHVGLRCHVPHEHDRRDSRFGGQFGMSSEEVLYARSALDAVGIDIQGLHFHLGQGARVKHAYAASVGYIAQLCERGDLAPIYLDCGGGIDAAADVATAAADLATTVSAMKRELPSVRELWLENGRYLTRHSAVLILRVLDTKERPEGRYLICDGGRTNQALDADNGPQPLVIVPQRIGRSVLTTIAGPTCMTDDRLARLMLPDSIAAGDLVVWFNAGAYHLPWETRFSHGLCAVIWGDASDRLSLARQRETPERWSDLWTASH
jgi:diaminopimelate decarboxylase